MSFMQYKNLGRNDLCACRSGKKFKRCHESAYNRIKLVMQSFGKNDYETSRDFIIPGAAIVEMPIDQWSGFKSSI